MKITLIVICGALIGILVGATGVYFVLGSGDSDDKVSIGAREEGIVTVTDATSKTFSHARYGFAVTVPKEIEIHEYPEGNASDTIVFQKPNEKLGFQIFATPYVGDEITKERLAQDVKGGSIEQPTEVVIGTNQRALIFWSNDPLVGRLREVWFIHEGFLYEVTTYAELDAWLAEILKTWQFSS